MNFRFRDLRSGEKLLHVTLWLAQCYLAIRISWTGWQQVFWSPGRMALQNMYYVFEVPLPMLRTIGLAGLAGAVGLVLPSLTRIAPMMTPLAAGGVILLQFSAIFFNITHEMFYQFFPENLGLLLPAFYVAFGREEMLPIPPRWEITSHE